MTDKERLIILAARLEDFPVLAGGIREVIESDSIERVTALNAAFTGFFYRKREASPVKQKIVKEPDPDDWAFSIL